MEKGKSVVISISGDNKKKNNNLYVLKRGEEIAFFRLKDIESLKNADEREKRLAIFKEECEELGYEVIAYTDFVKMQIDKIVTREKEQEEKMKNLAISLNEDIKNGKLLKTTKPMDFEDDDEEEEVLNK